MAAKGDKAVKDNAIVKCAEFELRHADYTKENFYEKDAMALENLVDALLIEKQGTSARIVRVLTARGAGAAFGFN